MKIDKAAILRYYRDLTPAPKQQLPFSFNELTLINYPGIGGLGDCVMLTDLPRTAAAHNRMVSVFAASDYFKALTKFNPYYRFALSPFLISTQCVQIFDLGNGHIIQRLQRAYGFYPDSRPRGCIEVPHVSRTKNKVVFHFEPSSHTIEQRKARLHSHPRKIYPENMAAIQRFVERHPEMHFIEIGNKFSGLQGVEDLTGLPLEATIEHMASCEYFIGICSGPLHVAAALELKLIMIINFPCPTRLYLPLLKNIDLPDSEWLYPQGVILHQDGEGELVARFSSENLDRAVAGELYPYWSEDYLLLIHERI